MREDSRPNINGFGEEIFRGRVCNENLGEISGYKLGRLGIPPWPIFRIGWRNITEPLS